MPKFRTLPYLDNFYFYLTSFSAFLSQGSLLPSNLKEKKKNEQHTWFSSLSDCRLEQYLVTVESNSAWLWMTLRMCLWGSVSVGVHVCVHWACDWPHRLPLCLAELTLPSDERKLTYICPFYQVKKESLAIWDSSHALVLWILKKPS